MILIHIRITYWIVNWSLFLTIDGYDAFNKCFLFQYLTLIFFILLNLVTISYLLLCVSTIFTFKKCNPISLVFKDAKFNIYG